jgi:hypothetical protein
VLRSASTFVGLQVDQVIGEQEIVIKQIEGPVPKPTGIAGATVLGRWSGHAHRRCAGIHRPGRWTCPSRANHLDHMGTISRRRYLRHRRLPKSEPTVLIVDDSITVRELLSMSFNKVGYRVEQARDGQEAWEKLRAWLAL